MQKAEHMYQTSHSHYFHAEEDFSNNNERFSGLLD